MQLEHLLSAKQSPVAAKSRQLYTKDKASTREKDEIPFVTDLDLGINYHV